MRRMVDAFQFGAPVESRRARRLRVLAAFILATIALLYAYPARSAQNAEPPPRDRGRVHEEPPPRIDPTKTFVWLDGGVGYGAVDLTTFRANAETFAAGLVPTRAGGPAANVGLGVRLLVFTLGARAGVMALHDNSSDHAVSNFDLWRIGAEAGFRIPLGRFEPYFVLGVDYATIGGMGDAIAGVGRGLDVDGVDASAGIGLDYFTSQHFSIGARFTGEALFLSRRAVPVRDLAQQQNVGTLSEAKARILEADGSSAGTAYSIVIGPGLHF